MTKIESRIVNLPKVSNMADIEVILSEKYGDIVRWAVIDSCSDSYKISFSYELKEA